MTKPSTPHRRSCFVIGPIGREATPIRRASDLLLNLIIKDALKDLPIDVRRVDEISVPTMISHLFIGHIDDDDLVIADLTTHNPNAFYELGIRHTREKPTILMASVGTDLPFDTAGHNTIFFDLTDYGSIEQARKNLRDQVDAAFAPGFHVSNPVTQARLMKEALGKPASAEQARLVEDLTKQLAAAREENRRINERQRSIQLESSKFALANAFYDANSAAMLSSNSASSPVAYPDVLSIRLGTHPLVLNPLATLAQVDPPPTPTKKTEK